MSCATTWCPLCAMPHCLQERVRVPPLCQSVQTAKTAAAKVHLECQRQMLKGKARALPEAAPLGCAFSHTDYLSNAHFHMHWLVKEHLLPQVNRSVNLELVRQTFYTREPSAIPLGTAVDSCLLEPSHQFPCT